MTNAELAEEWRGMAEELEKSAQSLEVHAESMRRRARIALEVAAQYDGCTHYVRANAPGFPCEDCGERIDGSIYDCDFCGAGPGDCHCGDHSDGSAGVNSSQNEVTP